MLNCVIENQPGLRKNDNPTARIMEIMSCIKTLTFDALRESISCILHAAPDHRQVSKTEYLLHDIALSGFACMFLQCPSLLEFQHRLVKAAHAEMTFIRMGDSLYAHGPFIRETLEQGDHYLFAIKPGDHKHLTRITKNISFNRHEESTKDQKITYEWALQQPLTATIDSPKVNIIRSRKVSIHKKTGEIKNTWLGTWITDLDVNEMNVAKLVAAARTRWRIENECFNTLKNQGYAIEHNFGHGNKNLCLNFYILTLLAFFVQQIGDLCDSLYQQARAKAGTLRCFWQDIRALINRFLFPSWYKLLEQIIDYRKHTFISFPER